MWNFSHSNIQPIGLDMGHDTVKLLQLAVTAENNTRGLSVVAAGKHELPMQARRDPAQRSQLSIEAIDRLLQQQPFSGRDVVASLPREAVHVKNLRLPMIPLAELDSAARFEARSAFAFDIDEAIVQLLPAGEVRQGSETRQEVICLAVKKADIDKQLEQLHRCGLVVRALDTEITGLFRAFERYVRRREDEQDVQMLIDIGSRRTQVIIGKGRDINFYKPIEIGGIHLLDAVSRKLSITPDEARSLRHRLLDPEQSRPVRPGQRDPVRQAVFDATRAIAQDLGRELAMCLRYYTVTFRGHRGARVRVVGGEAADHQLMSILQGLLNTSVEPGRPLFSADTSRMRQVDRRGDLSQWCLATGLALRFVPGYFPAKDGKPRPAMMPNPAGPVSHTETAVPAPMIKPDAAAASVIEIDEPAPADMNQAQVSFA